MARLNRLLKTILPQNRFYAKSCASSAPTALADPDGPACARSTIWPSCRSRSKTSWSVRRQPGDLAANLTFPVEQYTRFHQTSGTRGRPLVVLDTADDWAWWIDCWQFVLDAAEIAPGDRVFMAFSFGPFVGFWSASTRPAAAAAWSCPAAD